MSNDLWGLSSLWTVLFMIKIVIFEKMKVTIKHFRNDAFLTTVILWLAGKALEIIKAKIINKESAQGTGILPLIKIYLRNFMFWKS